MDFWPFILIPIFDIFRSFHQNLFYLLFFSYLTFQWHLIESSFFDISISSENWQKTNLLNNQIEQINIGSCVNNGQQYVLMDSQMNIFKAYKIGHYQLRIISTLFFFNNDDGDNTVFSVGINDQVAYQIEYNNFCSTTFQIVNNICSASLASNYYYQTIAVVVNSNNFDFTIKFSFNPKGSNKAGIRDVFVYANLCHFSCKECVGPNENDCTNCYSGNVNGGQCQCKTNDNIFLMKEIGCISECLNDYYLADNNNYCQETLVISSLSKVFALQSIGIDSNDWQYFSDLNDLPLSQYLDSCNYENQNYHLIGLFNDVSGFKYQLQNIPGLAAIRLRITFTFISFNLNSSIFIYLDDKLQATINHIGYQNQSCVLTTTHIGQCQDIISNISRYEIILKAYKMTPVLRINGITSTQEEKWGFHNVTIDKILCAPDCMDCFDSQNCKQCSIELYLHKGQCVKSCPKYSNPDTLAIWKCIDFDEIIKYSQYLIKAFYDFNTTIEDIETFIGTQSWSSMTGQYFSYFPNKMILGGPMIWSDQEFKKTFTVRHHYAYSLRMNVILGDDYTNYLSYQISPGSEFYVVKSASSYVISVVGDNLIEYLNDVFVLAEPHNDQTFTIILKCIGATPTQGFCAINKYSLVIHYCHPLCQTSCTGPELGNCTIEPADCLTNYYYSQTKNGYQCKECPKECLTCNSQTYCTTCDSTKGIFDLIKGECVCQSPLQIKDNGLCKSCHYSCQTCFGIYENSCITCSLRRKLDAYRCECDNGYYEDSTQNCLPICGDGILAYGEQCDDGNEVANDGCYQCQLQCQTQCTLCVDGICSQCNTPYWQLNNNSHLCEPICGDGYAVEGMEECDDGNQMDEDGCYQCYFTCQKECTLCQLGRCYECNTLGWIWSNNLLCEPICGDGLIIGNEQCDDMNEIQYDGCYQCNYQCDEYCTTCLNGICWDCTIGRYLSENQCISLCGDGILVEKNEQCDDGNINNLDGCDMNCNVEKDWFCQGIPNEISDCIYFKAPEFQLTLKTKVPTDIEIIEISFTQLVKSNISVEEIKQYMWFQIQNMMPADYQIASKFITDPSQEEVKEVSLSLLINFFIPCKHPQLNVTFISELFQSKYGINLLDNSKQLTLLTPMVLSTKQKMIAESTEKFNTVAIYSLAGVSSLCLLTGSLELFWNLMDQLQYLSYLKYIDVSFPNNLNIFFQAFNLVSLSPIMEFIGFKKLINGIIVPNEIVPAEKFAQDGINAFFLDNFQSSIFCIIIALLGFVISHIAKLGLKHYLLYLSGKIGFLLTKLLMRSKRIFEKAIIEFFFNCFLRLAMSNCYDCSFAAYLQIASYEFNLEDNPILFLNFFFAIFIALGQLWLTLVFINITHQFSSRKTIKKQKQFSSMFEGVKFKKQDFWIFQFNSIYFLKKQVFIFFIVFLQENGVIQTIAIAINQVIFVSYLLLNKPLESNYEYSKVIVTEVLIIVASTTFIIYPLHEVLLIQLEENIVIGWFHIGQFCFILTFSFLIDVIQQFQAIKQNIVSKSKPKSVEVKSKNIQRIFF